MSTLIVYAWRWSISGARYPLVPRNDAVVLSASSSLASPKSMIFTSAPRDLLVSIRFSNDWRHPWAMTERLVRRMGNVNAIEARRETHSTWFKIPVDNAARVHVCHG